MAFNKRSIINKKQKSVPRIEYIIKNIKTGNDYIYDLNMFKYLSSDNNFIDGVVKLFSDNDVRNKLIGVDITDDAAELYNNDITIIGKLEREMFWSSCELFNYKNKINEFIKYKYEYENSVLVGNFIKAKQILDKIENDFGISFWAIENRLALIGYTENHEELREYESSILMSAQNNPLLIGVIQNLVHKSTIESSDKLLGKFTNSLIRTVEELGHKQVLDYFKFKLDQSNYKVKNYGSIIAWERLMPIVDRYETFVKICQKVCIENDNYSVKWMVKSIANISDKIEDHRLKNIYHYIDDKRAQLNTKYNEIYDVIDLYITGKHDLVVSRLETHLKQNPNHYILWEMLAKSAILSGTKRVSDAVPYSNIINDMINVLLLNDNYSESSTRLKNISRIFSSSSFSDALNEFLYSNYSYCEENNLKVLIKTTDLSCELITPRFIIDSSNNNLANMFFMYCPNATELVLNIRRKYIDGILCSNLPDVRKSKSLISVYASLKMYDSVETVCKKLLSSSTSIYRVMALRNLVTCLIAVGNYDECIDVLVDSILNKHDIVYSLQVESILSQIEATKNSIKDDNLKALILYDCYSKYISSDRNDKISDMFDKFVNINGYDTPLDIISQKKYTISEIIYFLKNICITENLDVLDMLSTREDVYTERIKICTELKSLDPDKRDEYDSVIGDVITKIIVEGSISHVDGGRIFIDIDGLKRTVQTNFASNFYALKSEYSVGPRGEEHFTEVGDWQSDKSNAATQVTPVSVFGRKLFNLYKELYKEFKENTEYGLDCSLGTDIRHGHLSNQIRPILDRHKLIYQKGSDGKYTSDKYWIDRYSVVSQRAAKLVESTLIKLSADIDKLIEELKTNWFNITGKRFPALALRQSDFTEMQGHFNACDNSDEFLSYLLLNILKASENNLIELKKDFMQYYSSKMNEIFNGTMNPLEDDAVNMIGIIDELKFCKNELLISGDEIASWISFSSQLDPPNFDISIPIKHSIDVFTKIYQHKNIEIATDIQCNIVVAGKHLRSFVRIFIILIENAVKHSGLTEIYVRINVVGDTNRIKIAAFNKLNNKIDTEQLQQKVNNILHNIKTENYMQVSANDKNSGIYKIARIINANLRCTSDISILVSKGEFKIELDMDCERILS